MTALSCLKSDTYRAHISGAAALAGVVVFGLGPASMSAASESVERYLQRPPVEALYDTAESSRSRQVEVTPEALALIRRAVISWPRTEVGAPRLDPRTPFGRDAGADMPRTIAEAEAMVTLVHHLNDFAARAVLVPGDYPLSNLTADAIRQKFAWAGADAASLGLTSAGGVTVTGDHLKLIREMLWEWPNRHEVADLLDLGGIPAPAIDPKRPYGAMSYYQLDVHRILGWPIERRDADGYIELTEAQVDAATRLHHQMMGVMQVFLEHAELPE
ncbi:MAG: hypothetical protein AAF666_01860 [Pseudomonadota bacterium]